MLDDVYNTKILEFAAAVPEPARLERADGSAVRHSKLCGSKVTIDVAVDGDVIADLAMDVKACALGQAAAAIVHANARGASFAEVADARDAMQAMLRGTGSPPEGRFADLRFLEPVRDYRARHASTLLAIEALAEAFEHARTNAVAA